METNYSDMVDAFIASNFKRNILEDHAVIPLQNSETGRRYEYRVTRDLNASIDKLVFHLWFIDGNYATVVNTYEGNTNNSLAMYNMAKQFTEAITEYLRVHTECRITITQRKGIKGRESMNDIFNDYTKEELVEKAMLFQDYVNHHNVCDDCSIEEEVPIFKRALDKWNNDSYSMVYHYFTDFLDGEWEMIEKNNREIVMQQLHDYVVDLGNNFRVELDKNPDATFEQLLKNGNPITNDDDYLTMEVYLDTIIPDFETDTNIAEIEVKKSVLEQYYRNEIEEDFFGTFDTFYNEYDGDFVEDLYEYAKRHNGLKHNYKEDYYAGRCTLYDTGLTYQFRYDR